MTHIIPRILIAGSHSGSGKTTLTLGIISALRRRGLKVQAFKVGPDYLDPTWLTAASGRPCYNLDGWMGGRDYVERLFRRVTLEADIAVIEGVMGLFDGANASEITGSSAEIALWLQAPVLLVVNAHGMGRSIAPLVAGFAGFEKGVSVRGVIANHRGLESHRAILCDALAADYDLKTYLDFTRLEDESQFGLTSTLDALTFGVKNETSWSADDNQWALRLSGNIAQDRIDHTLSGDHNREYVSLGLQGDKNFDSLTASLGGRCDYTSDFNFQPAASGGLSFNLSSRSQAKINAGYAVNVPTFGQLYQPSHGSIDQVRGNPDLEEESVWTVAAGINHRFSDKSSVEVTLFREDTDDKIAYQEGADQIKRPVNIDGAYRQGIETVVNWKPTSTTSFDLSYVFQKSRNRDNDQELTYTPKHRFKITMNWTLPTKTRTETSVTSISSHYSDIENTSEKKVGGYVTLDLKIIQPVGFPKCQTELFIYFENLLDEAYEVHYGYPDDGFRVTAGLNIDF